MTHEQIVQKLIGKIDPIGETNEDNRRYGNLEEMCTLVNKLLFQIHQVSKEKDNHQHSIKRAGQYAYQFLKEVKEADL